MHDELGRTKRETWRGAVWVVGVVVDSNKRPKSLAPPNHEHIRGLQTYRSCTWVIRTMVSKWAMNTLKLQVVGKPIIVWYICAKLHPEP